MSTVFRVYNESTGQWEAILAGEQGVQGPQGWQGQEGAGFQGPQGWQGQDGSIGVDGTQGAQGWQGAAGQDGSIGVDGSQGPQGWQGAAGPLTTADIFLGNTQDGVITFDQGGTGEVQSKLTFSDYNSMLTVNGDITANNICAKAYCVNNTNGDTCLKFWSGTQSQYDALTPAADTIYFIV
jgi:hypothetical protein